MAECLFRERLQRSCPLTYADKFLDNVGGPGIDAKLPLVKGYGYVCTCEPANLYRVSGTPKSWSSSTPAYSDRSMKLENWMQIITRKGAPTFYVAREASTIPEGQGSSSSTHLGRQQAHRDVLQRLAGGKITSPGGAHIAEAKFEDIPNVCVRSFKGAEGQNGKLITELVSSRHNAILSQSAPCISSSSPPVHAATEPPEAFATRH